MNLFKVSLDEIITLSPWQRICLLTWWAKILIILGIACAIAVLVLTMTQVAAATCGPIPKGFQVTGQDGQGNCTIAPVGSVGYLGGTGIQRDPIQTKEYASKEWFIDQQGVFRDSVKVTQEFSSPPVITLMNQGEMQVKLPNGAIFIVPANMPATSIHEILQLVYAQNQVDLSRMLNEYNLTVFTRQQDAKAQIVKDSLDTFLWFWIVVIPLVSLCMGFYFIKRHRQPAPVPAPVPQNTPNPNVIDERPIYQLHLHGQQTHEILSLLSQTALPQETTLSKNTLVKRG